MFGLGKLNLLIKRYELAARWFTDALAQKRDYVYKVWLAFTHVKLANALTPANPKKLKYLEYAVRDYTKCVKEDDLAHYCITALLFLSLEKHDYEIKGLETPQKYLDGLTTCLTKNKKLQDHDFTVELTLAQAYHDLKTPRHQTKGTTALSRLLTQ